MLNYDLTEADEEHRIQLSELDEIKAAAYESARSCKERAQLLHEKHILRKELAPGMKVFM